MSLHNVYSKKIFRHAKNPKHKQVLETATAVLKTDNPSCGDALTLYLEVDGQGMIQDISWQGSGCAVSQAAASLFCEKYSNSRVAELEKITEDDWLSQFDITISPARLKCALLPFICIHEHMRILKK